MTQIRKHLFILLVAFLAYAFLAGSSILLAQGSNNPQKYNEAIRSAQQSEMLGYILAGVGILLVVVSIPLGIYLDRKKKARKRTAQQAEETRGSSDAAAR